MQQPTPEGHGRNGSTVSAAGAGGARSDRIRPSVRRSSSGEQSLKGSPNVRASLLRTGFGHPNALYGSQTFMMAPSPVDTDSTLSTSLGATTSPVTSLRSSPTTSTGSFGLHYCGLPHSHGSSCSRPTPALSSLSPSSGTPLLLGDTQASGSNGISFNTAIPTVGPTHTRTAPTARHSLHELSLAKLASVGQT